MLEYFFLLYKKGLQFRYLKEDLNVNGRQLNRTDLSFIYIFLSFTKVYRYFTLSCRFALCFRNSYKTELFHTLDNVKQTFLSLELKLWEIYVLLKQMFIFLSFILFKTFSLFFLFRLAPSFQMVLICLSLSFHTD